MLRKLIRRIAMATIIESMSWINALESVVDEGLDKLNRKGAGVYGDEPLSSFHGDNGVVIEFTVNRYASPSCVMLRVSKCADSALYDLLFAAAMSKYDITNLGVRMLRRSECDFFDLNITAYAAQNARLHF